MQIPNIDHLPIHTQRYVLFRAKTSMSDIAFGVQPDGSAGKRYYSKAYRAYVRRLLENFGVVKKPEPVDPKLLESLGLSKFWKNSESVLEFGSLLADQLLEDMNRPSFMRLMLDPKAAEQYSAECEEKKRLIEAFTSAFKEVLLPYSRHYDYSKRGYNEVSKTTSPAQSG